MQSQRWAWTYRHGVPLLIASIVAVVLAGAGLIAVIALSGGEGSNGGQLGAGPESSPDPDPDPGPDPDPDPDPGPDPGPGATEDAAECVVGRWRVVEYEQVMTLGVLTLIENGPELHFNEDGTGLTDYGEQSDYYFRDTSLGGFANTDMLLAGQITYRYHLIDNNTMRYTDIVSDATITTEAGPTPQEISDEPFGFACDGDVMTYGIDDRMEGRMERLS